MQALILAGGKGTRLRPLTLSTPKPITTIANRPFLYYQLELLKKAGVDDVSLSLSYQPEKIIDVFGDGSSLDLSISYPVEPEPLGTAGAFKFAEEHIHGTTIVFNGDILTNIDLGEVVALHKARKATATIVLVPIDNPSAYGLVETRADGSIKRFLEKPKADEITCNTINAGMYVLEPQVFKYIPPGENHSFEYGLFPRLLAEGEPFYSVVSNEYWLDIGTNARYLQANLDVIAGKLSYLPAREQHNHLPASVKIDTNSLVAPSAKVGENAQIINSVIGEDCIIAPGAHIENSVILTATSIHEAAQIKGSIIGRKCQIGASAIIGENSVLGDETHITDFSQMGGKL